MTEKDLPYAVVLMPDPVERDLVAIDPPPFTMPSRCPVRIPLQQKKPSWRVPLI